jgi:hypothetical protein
MSTQNQTAGWYPRLEGQGLPGSLVTGVGQAYNLIYSLRDALRQAVGSLLGSTNTIPKVSSGGQLVPSSITDDGQGNVGMSNDATVLPDTGTAVRLLVGSRAASSPPAEVAVIRNTTVPSTPIGSFAFANYNLSTADKRIAVINGTTDTVVNSGRFSFYTANAGVLAERMRITSAGNVGIGTAAPTNKLHLYSTTGDGSDILVQTTGDGAFVKVQNGTGANYKGLQGLAGDGSVDFIIGHLGMSGHGMNFSAGSVEAMRITAAGSVGIGTSAPTFLLQLSADSAGKPGSSSWSVVSDARLKENVEPVADDSLAILDALKWVRYEYNGQGNTPHGLKAIGLSAQELSAHLPEAVRSTRSKLVESDTEESEILAIDYHHILVHTARAVQQLSLEVKRLKQKQP